MIDMAGVMADSKVTRSHAGVAGRLERRQIAEMSRFDSQARIRQTGALVGAQKAALAASGVAGGRTARLLEAQARMTASRQQEQADMQTALGMTASRLRQQQIRGAAKMRNIKARTNVLQTDLQSAANMGGLMGGFGG